jgi:epoxyqueuosine reductase QueG
MYFDALDQAPGMTMQNEVKEQYDRGTNAAQKLAEWMRQMGWGGVSHGGPIAGPVLMIPHAIEAGLGEPGKHGSMINKRYGSSFRLANVLTDLPLVPGEKEIFGADDFCQNCQLCTRVCPVDAINPEKVMVRGEVKWYVDFDKCLLFFVEHKSCAMCLPSCPWSRPGVADKLLLKMAKRRED